MTAPSTEGLTRRVAVQACDVDAAKLSEHVRQQARLMLADTVGVLLAASVREAVRSAIAAVGGDSGTGATIVGHAQRAAADAAALINGIGGHDIELDDIHASSRTHPAAVLVPAALATAELDHGRTVGDLIAALVAGYDVMTRLSKALGPSKQYDHGFHPSALTGSIGAAACAGRMLGLDAEQMHGAIALAASQCSGLLTYYADPFHLQKSFQTGMAARNGVTAARFAKAGYCATPEVLVGRRSVLEVFGREHADPTRLTATTEHEIMSTTLKRHACCALTHSAVDALWDVLDANRIDAEHVQTITVQLPIDAKDSVDGNPLWTHNIQYVLALAAGRRQIMLEHFTSDWTDRPALRELAARVSVEASGELQSRFPERIGAVVTVTTADGSFSRQQDSPIGSPDEPMSEEQVAEKFRQLSRTVLDESDSESLWKEIMSAPLDDPASPLISRLAAAPDPVRSAS
jgi:2-methylcitrate dehydratase PrpD